MNELEKRKIIGKAILQKRLDLCLNQKEMAKKLGITTTTQFYIERGKNFINLKTLENIIKILEIDINIQEDEQKPKSQKIKKPIYVKTQKEFLNRFLTSEILKNPNISFEELNQKRPDLQRYYFYNLRSRLNRSGFKLSRCKRQPNQESVQRKNEMIELKKSGISLQNIGIKYNLSRERVRQIIGKDCTKFKTHTKWFFIKNQKFWDDNINLTNREISKKYCIPIVVVGQIRTQYDFLPKHHRDIIIYVLEKLKELNFNVCFKNKRLFVNNKNVKIKINNSHVTTKFGHTYFGFTKIKGKIPYKYFILAGKAKNTIYCFVIPNKNLPTNGTSISYNPTGRIPSKYSQFLNAWHLLRNENVPLVVDYQI